MSCDVCGKPGHTLEACAYTPYIRRLQKLMMSYCLPVWFRNESGDRAKGSMTVVVSEKLMPPHVEVAGISGGGVFRLIERTAGNVVESSLELAGIIYFGSAAWEVVNAHPLRSLNPNG